jgi:hypothetical protein
LICAMRPSMSFFFPTPLTIVVFSFSIITPPEGNVVALRSGRARRRPAR